MARGMMAFVGRRRYDEALGQSNLSHKAALEKPTLICRALVNNWPEAGKRA